jgi:hypothetical protein
MEGYKEALEMFFIHMSFEPILSIWKDIKRL